MKKAWFLSVLALFMLCAVPAQANTITYQAILSGPAESPPNASPGTGLGIITIDDVANTMRVQINVRGFGHDRHRHDGVAHPLLHGRAGHRHRDRRHADADVPGFPLGVRSGTYDHTFDLGLASSWNPAFITANGDSVASAEAVFLAGLGEWHGVSEHPLRSRSRAAKFADSSRRCRSRRRSRCLVSGSFAWRRRRDAG